VTERADRYQFVELLRNKLVKETELHRPHVFLGNLRDRLALGAQEYGNKSFSREFEELVDEILQEDVDRAGWSYIIWAKAKTMLNNHGKSLPTHQLNILDSLCDAAVMTAERAYAAWESNSQTLYELAYRASRDAVPHNAEEDCC
jgi:hypothetical protein